MSDEKPITDQEPVEPVKPVKPVKPASAGVPIALQPGSKYPPISIRLSVLQAVSPDLLIPWAEEVSGPIKGDAKVAKRNAIAAILRYEYGEEQFKTLRM